MKIIFVLAIAFIIFFVSVEKICKLKMLKNESDEIQKVSEKKENSDGFLGFIEDMTPLGLGISVSFLGEFFYASSVGVFGNELEKYSASSELIVDMAIFSIMQIIGFVIFFYIVYGILSLIKSHNGNEQAQRNVAGWTSVIVDLALIMLAVN